MSRLQDDERMLEQAVVVALLGCPESALYRYFGKRPSLEQLAALTGLSHARIGQIEQNALRKMRRSPKLKEVA